MHVSLSYLPDFAPETEQVEERDTLRAVVAHRFHLCDFPYTLNCMAIGSFVKSFPSIKKMQS